MGHHMKTEHLYSRIVSTVALTFTLLILAGGNSLKGFQADEPSKSDPGPVNPKLYGSTSNEKTIPPDDAPKITPLRSRSVDTIIKLSKPRSEVIKESAATGPGKMMKKGPAPNPEGTPVISVDYEVVSEKTMGGDLSLILRTSDGQDATVSIGKLEKRAGKISLKVADASWRKGPFAKGPPLKGPGEKDKPPSADALPQNFEMYLVRNETRYGKDNIRSFKVSNSVIMGETKFAITEARDWTPLEGSIFAMPPIEPPKPGLNRGIGEDTKFVGKAPAATGPALRYIDPKQPLIGVDLVTTFWPIQGGGREDCLGNLTPIFNRDYPDMGQTRVLAKPGYAVGAITVKANHFVNSIQITFMKLNADNSGLDPKDSYTSPWQGPDVDGAKETKLGGDGRKVIGVYLNKFGILEGLALVMDSYR
jgi:hypothetical protein